jgi:hypothetical protein
VEFGERAVIVTVVLKAKKPVCSGCGARGLKVKEHRTKPWRHLDQGGAAGSSAGCGGCIARAAATSIRGPPLALGVGGARFGCSRAAGLLRSCGLGDGR